MGIVDWLCPAPEDTHKSSPAFFSFSYPLWVPPTSPFPLSFRYRGGDIFPDHSTSFHIIFPDHPIPLNPPAPPFSYFSEIFSLGRERDQRQLNLIIPIFFLNPSIFFLKGKLMMSLYTYFQNLGSALCDGKQNKQKGFE